MAAVAGTGTSLSANYYLRNFYTANRNAVTSSKRKEMTGGTLSQADATALHRAAKKLRNFNYEDDTTDSANIYGSVNAFIQVYNNTLSSGNKTDDASLNRYSRYLKSHSSELSRIGITVNSDGSLSANDNLLKSAKVSKVKTLFADDAEYITKVSRYSKKMAEKADSVVLSETLGSNIDLTL
jgi:hypothetical protein